MKEQQGKSLLNAFSFAKHCSTCCCFLPIFSPQWKCGEEGVILDANNRKGKSTAPSSLLLIAASKNTTQIFFFNEKLTWSLYVIEIMYFCTFITLKEGDSVSISKAAGNNDNSSYLFSMFCWFITMTSVHRTVQLQLFREWLVPLQRPL